MLDFFKALSYYTNMKTRYDTLILNRLYIPNHIVSWQRAVSLLYQGAARSLDMDLIPYDWDSWIEYSRLPGFDDTYYNYVNSTSLKVAVPDILVLSTYDRLPIRDVKATRENIFARDHNKCAYCGQQFKRVELTIDHIIPKSHGGNNSWKNCISSCKSCNHKKSDKTPEQAGMPLKFKPTEPKWCDALHKVIKNQNIRPNWMKFLGGIGEE